MYVTRCGILTLLMAVSISAQTLFYLPHNQLLQQTISCPDGITQCPPRFRCCKLFDQYGCCPLPKPNGNVQILEESFSFFDEVKVKEQPHKKEGEIETPSHIIIENPGRESDLNRKLAMFKTSSSGGAVECPGGVEECPTGYTCCLQSNQKYGCCPSPNAVCCEDNVHCCPFEYTCVQSDGRCVKQGISISMLRKQRARPVLKKLNVQADKPELDNVYCPGRKGICVNGSTCCLTKLGHYSCCPLPSGTCCADKVHCCPQNFTCDLKLGMCTKGDQSVQPLKKHSSSVEVKSIMCPDGEHECMDGQTCCETETGSYGCCPNPDAVCCSDHKHCCPHNYRCDLARSQCVQGNDIIKWFEKRPAAVSNSGLVYHSSVICPDGEHMCKNGQTCCKLASGPWGCCPRENAVCCDDGKHCCPHGTTCNAANNTCSGGNGFTHWLEKMPALSRKSVLVLSEVLITCPDGKSACKQGYTCCMTSPGNYGCCPLEKAVCCSDRKHCCPEGTSCDGSSAKCIKSRTHLDLVTISDSTISSESRNVGDNYIVCPGGKQACQSNSTCCMLTTGKYGCCPRPKAVCCKDKVHCCPQNSKCDLTHNKCVNGREVINWFEKLPAVSVSSVSHQLSIIVCPDGKHECKNDQTCCKTASGYGCCPQPHAVCCSDGKHCCPSGYTCDVSSGKCNQGNSEMDWLEKLPAVNNVQSAVMCPDGKSQCSSGSTCCKLKNGHYGCCPRPNAVCCSDGIHCCPSGTTCEVSAGKCKRGNIVMDWLEKLPAMETALANVVCPDKTQQCPSGSTCCKLQSGDYGCCPLPKAVCCSDGVHCCPSGTTCDVSAGTCSGENIVMDWLEKLPTLKSSVSTITCKDNSTCKDGQTCCKLKTEHYGCCPRPNAVCCKDGIHCCPSGTKCDVSAGKCNRGNIVMDWLEKLPTLESSVSTITCDDGTTCKDGQTCCKLKNGRYGCCPRPNAVCCKDGVHCCPSGTKCDVSAGKCNRGNIVMDWLEKLPTLESSVSTIACDDGSTCKDGQTCCKLKNGRYGCCPQPNAVCCSDGVHCCPNGYKCKVSSGKCMKGDTEMAWLEKVSTVKGQDTERNLMCPDGVSQCQEGQTCCKTPSGYGCCPLPKAVCCDDGLHCCPESFKCNNDTKKCQLGPVHFTWESLTSRAAVMCPDGESECMDGQTCCLLLNGKYGCCPFPDAVCCSDHQHCCRQGEVCDMVYKRCGSIDGQSTEMLKKLPALPRISATLNCPDGKSNCPNNNTCCKNNTGFSCCPYEKAYCCNGFCCPHGYICDEEPSICRIPDTKMQNNKILQLLGKRRGKPLY